MASEYSAKLKDPRWVEKRKEILKRDNNKCQKCGDEEKLQVHHKRYKKDTNPWDYKNSDLITLCQSCHEREHESLNKNKSKIRNLEISKSLNLKGCKEFNHLRIININEFLDEYSNNLDYYASPFKILSDLEIEIKFKNNPDKDILIEYKPGGDIIFLLLGIQELNDLRIVTYLYNGSIS